jgi:hypothetical protein
MSTDRDRDAVAAVWPGDFRHRAACREVDPELFFPTAESGTVWQAQVAAAKAVCAGCPVRAECLAWALQALPDGVAGGMTPQERRREGRRPWAGRRGVQRVSAQPLTPSSRSCRPIGGARSELGAAGRAALAAGASPRQVAVEFRVTARTVQRWAQDLRTSACVAGVGRGAPAATGLPSGSPTTQTPGQGHEQRKDTDPR